MNVLGSEHQRLTYDMLEVITAFSIPAILARPARNRDTCLPLEGRAKRMFENVGGGQTGAQEEAEGKNEGGAELHDDVLVIIDDGVDGGCGEESDCWTEIAGQKVLNESC